MPATAKPRRSAGRTASRPAGPALGERVRALRLARGMTQAQLAGSDFSKGFISLVETGRTSMSLRAMEIIAQRLGVSVSELLAAPPLGPEREMEFLLLRAEADLSAGRAAAALELTAPLVSRTTGLLRARVQRLRGRALAQLRRPEAVKLLEEARRAFEAAGVRELVVRTTFDLALAHGRADEFGESLRLVLECERALRSDEVVDRALELQVLSYLADKFVALGDVASADLLTERAKKLAEESADLQTMANLYYTLAITRQEQGDAEAALTYARRSLAAWEQLGTQAQIASTWNTIGWVYLRRKQFSRAQEALDRAERMAHELHDDRLLAYVLQTRGELALARGAVAEAIRLATASAEHPGASARARALSLLLKAEATARSRAPLPVVRAAFDAALRALAHEGRRLLGQAHQAYFQALERRGRSREASRQARKALELLQPVRAGA